MSTTINRLTISFGTLFPIKYTLQSLEGQKKRGGDKVTKNSLIISLVKCTLQSLKKIIK